MITLGKCKVIFKRHHPYKKIRRITESEKYYYISFFNEDPWDSTIYAISKRTGRIRSLSAFDDEGMDSRIIESYDG